LYRFTLFRNKSIEHRGHQGTQEYPCIGIYSKPKLAFIQHSFSFIDKYSDFQFLHTAI